MVKRFYINPTVEQLECQFSVALCTSNMPGTTPGSQDSEPGSMNGAPKKRVF